MLKQKLLAEIKSNGGIGVDRYIELCNTHYYSTRTPLGKEGDFTTAPEISQIFGEMIGIWLITKWQQLGSPKEIALVELGPGHGTLMADILRTIKPHFTPEVHFVEISPTLRESQKQKVPNATWHETYPKLTIPTLVAANEFFDALPIKQFYRHKGEIAERKILEQDGELYFHSPEVAFETSPISLQIAHDIYASSSGGIFIDYGYFGQSCADTLQAVKAHKYHPILQTPGEADLTAHVNFGALAHICPKKPQLTTQREFLLAHGADVRAKILGKEADLERLISPQGMGELFKVLCF